jgi:hypothetical protein
MNTNFEAAEKAQMQGARKIDPSAQFILSGVEGLRTG